MVRKDLKICTNCNADNKAVATNCTICRGHGWLGLNGDSVYYKHFKTKTSDPKQIERWTTGHCKTSTDLHAPSPECFNCQKRRAAREPSGFSWEQRSHE